MIERPRLKIFATDCSLQDLKPISPYQRLFGAHVATNKFFNSLIRFGSFKEYHFFVPPGEKRHCGDASGVGLPQPASSGKVRIQNKNDLPAFLKNTKDAIFFLSHPYIFKMAYMRSLYARHNFPICGVSHTISYSQQLEDAFFYNMVAHLQPFDSIICTSTAVQRAARAMFALVRKKFSITSSFPIRYKGRLDRLPLGVNTEDYMRFGKGEARRKLNLPKDKIIILYFGRFSILDKADLYPLLLVFKKLRAAHKNTLLILAGTNFQGHYGERVQRMAGEMNLSRTISFFFNPPERQKRLLYAACDIFVSPADNPQESFGLTVLEAMAAGKVAVVSDWDGYKDTVVHKETGFRVPTYWAKCDAHISDYTHPDRNATYPECLYLGQSVCVDTKRMLEYLDLLIRNRALREGLGNNARQRVLKEFDWSVLIPRYENLWGRLCKEARRTERPPQKNMALLPNFFSCFRHYPSTILDRKTRVAITEEGIRFLKRRVFPAGIPSENFIIPKVVLLLLLYLHTTKSASFNDVYMHTKEAFRDIARGRVTYYLMWMLKQNFIEVVRR